MLTFADITFRDQTPTSGPGGGIPGGPPFLVRPTQQTCDTSRLNTPHPALLVALMDGSVRTIRPGVAPEVFWAAVTPAGGEVGPDF
jgi:hypothetical protein